MTYQAIANPDVWFNNITREKHIINDLNYYDKNTIGNINEQLMTIYDSDTYNTIPRCNCGKIKNAYNLGEMCSSCGSAVSVPNKDIEPAFWIQAIKGMRFINPMMWGMFNAMVSSNLDSLRWLSDVKYNPKCVKPPFLESMATAIGGRNYTNLVNNFDKVIVIALASSHFKKDDKTAKMLAFKQVWDENPLVRTSQYLPVMSKKMFIMEKTSKGKFINLLLSDLIDLVLTVIKQTDKDFIKPDDASSLMGTILSRITPLYLDYINTFEIGKLGGLRRNIFGMRSHFTFRTVIASIAGPHHRDALYVPFVIGVTTYRPHIMNIMLKQNKYSYKEICNILTKATRMFIPEIHDILQKLVKDSWHPQGLPVLEQRNPTQHQGSIQLKYIVGFKDNIRDFTTSNSLLTAKNSNADYDGDQLNYLPLMSRLLYNEAKGFATHYNIPDTIRPFNIAGRFGLTGPPNSVISDWVNANLSNDQGVDTIFDKVAV